MSLSRYFAPAVLAASLGFAAVAAPAPAQAQSSELMRVLVNVADVVLRGNTPYYRNSDYGQEDRLIAQRDQYGRVVYYRNVPRDQYYGSNQAYGSNRYYGNDQSYGNAQSHHNGQPPYGNAYGYHRNAPVTGGQGVKCNKKGKCKAQYYDPRYDRDGMYGYSNVRNDRDRDRYEHDRHDRYEHNDDD